VTIGMTPVFAFIAFSDNILYPTYEFAPRLIARLDPADDQLLGAAIMKTGGIAVTLIAMSVAFYHWSRTGASAAISPAYPSGGEDSVPKART